MGQHDDAYDYRYGQILHGLPRTACRRSFSINFLRYRHARRRGSDRHRQRQLVAAKPNLIYQLSPPHALPYVFYDAPLLALHAK